MSQDETLRLAAEVVDKYSPVLRKMQRSLQELTDFTKKSNDQGKRGTKEHREEIGKLDKAFLKVNESVKSSVMPTIAALGITTLSAGAAVATLKDTLLGFASGTRELTYLSRETGLAVQNLREFDALGRRLNIPAPAMHKAFEQFAQKMHDIRRMVPSALNELRYGADANLNNLIRGMATKPTEEALSRIIGALDQIHDKTEKRQYLRLLGLPEGFANAPVGQLRQWMQEIQGPNGIGVLTKEGMKNAALLNKAFDHLQDSVENLKNAIGTDLAKSFADATDAVTKFVNENRSDLLVVLGDISKAIKGAIDDLKTLMRLYTDFRSGALSDGSKKFLFGGKGDPTDPLGVGHSFKDEPFFKGLGWLKEKWDQLNNQKGVFQKESYQQPLREGGGYRLTKASFSPDQMQPRFLPASFTTGGGTTRDAEAAIARGTKAGMIEALREWQAYNESDDLGAGGGARGGIAAVRAALGGGRVASLGGGVGGASAGLPGNAGVSPMGAAGAGAPHAMTRGDRNNNPGNIEYGDFAKAHGATGSDGRFAIFPNAASGARAMTDLLRQKYSGMSLAQIQRKWVGHPNAGYLSGMERATGLGPGGVPDLNNPAVAERLARSMATGEGTLFGGGPASGPSVGRANFMHGQFGGPGQNLTTITTAGGHRVTVNRASAAAMKGFLEQLERAGAPIHQSALGGYANRNKVGARGISQHAYGNAIDVDQVGRNVVTRDFAGWARSHGRELRAAVDRWHMISGGDWRNPDFGHFEWGGVPVDAAAKRPGHWTTGDVWNALNGVGNDSQLLRAGRKSGMLAPPAGHPIKGAASLDIHMHNVPRGTRTAMNTSGELWDKVSLNRGRAMVPATQEA